MFDPTIGEHNVEFYGAVGDDTADDRPALSAAVVAAAASGGIVTAGPRTYRLASFEGTVVAHVLGALVLARSGVRVRGAGIGKTIFKAGAGINTATCQAALFVQHHDLAASSGDGFVAEDFTWDGNGINNLLGVYNYWGDAVHLETSTGFVVRRVRCVNNPGSHCYAGGNNTSPHTVRIMRVEDCAVANIGNQIAGNTFQTDHSVIYGMARTLLVSGCDFASEYDDAGTALGMCTGTGIETHALTGHVHHNEIASFQHSINVGAQVTDTSSLEIDHNTGRGGYRGLVLWTAGGKTCTGLRIHHNTFSKLKYPTALIDLSTNVTTLASDIEVTDNRLVDAVVGGTGTINAADQTFTATGADPWLFDDLVWPNAVNTPIRIIGAGAAGADHITHIDSSPSDHVAEIHDAALTSVVDAPFVLAEASIGAISIGLCDRVLVKGNTVVDGYGPGVSVSTGDGAHVWRLLELADNTILDCGRNCQAFYLQGMKLDTVGTAAILRLKGNAIVNSSATARWMTTGISGTVSATLVDIDGSNGFANVPTLTNLASWDADPVLLRQLEWVSFTVQITNDAGTIKHSILEDNVNWSTLPTFAKLVSGASATLAATPTLSGVQNFVSGAGYSGVGGTSELVLDTPSQVVGEGSIQATVVVNSSNGIPNVIPLIRSEDVNGVTIPRLSLFFFIQGTTNPYALTTAANFDAGDLMYVHVQGYLRK